MKKEKPRIGVMGGTFNPIHYGHLVTAEEAFYQFKLDEIIFMPSGDPPHKDTRGVLPSEERYIMTVLATANNPHFSVSRFEIEKKTPSYTVETLKELSKNYPPQTQIFFITGADAVLEILTWKNPEEIFKYGRLIAATRPDYPLEKLKDLGKFKIASDFKDKEAEIYLMEIPALAISSTEIRERIREGRPVRYLLPEKVLEYITQRGFYQR